MIYITGDCHGDFRRLNKDIFPEQNEMTKDDCVIICGDFGGIWDMDTENSKEKWWLDWLQDKSFTTLFIDGNHENFDRLYNYPVEEWNGGKVHKIRQSVIHLMRGQVFEIDKKKIFVFGGASSHDIEGGILELDDPTFESKKKKLDRSKISYRVNHLNWWVQELPTEEEMEEGRENLEVNNNTVDFIISHCCASNTLALMSQGDYISDILTDYLEELRQKVIFKKWFFGHHHKNKNVTAKEILVYEQFIRIS
ncbi:metallophosphoesterase [Lachnospiraceae bacterium OttesenSCG-928-D06]|nr:metallophosphoesterase [Lachnospiraceae bacterium OttesenSCG-928-D06]